MVGEKPWTVVYHRCFEKEIRRLPRQSILRILDGVEGLQNDPRPSGSKKIAGHTLWRIRIGIYRVIYHIDEEKWVVSIYRVGHRGAVYRNL